MYKNKMRLWIGLGGMLLWLLICLWVSSLGLYSGLFVSYLTRPLLLLLNFIPLLISYLWATILLGRARWGFTVAAFFWIIMAIFSNVKIRFRQEPLTLADKDLFLPMLKIAPPYLKDIDLWMMAGAVVLILLLMILSRLFPSTPVGWRQRSKMLATAVLCMVLLSPAYLSDDLIRTPQMGLASLNGFIDVRAAMRSGYFYSMVNQSRSYLIPTSPRLVKDGQEILQSYPDSKPPKMKDMHIIVVLLESYKDFSGHKDMVTLQRDPYAPMHQLMAESLSGTLIADVYGGGTVHTELGVLGGYLGKTQPTIFRQEHSSYPHTFRRAGYQTEAMHPNTGSFYNRANLWPKLGFERFLSEENYFHYDNNTNGLYPDQRLFKEVQKRLHVLQENGSSFQMVTTLQNHGPYYSEFYMEPYFPYQKKWSRKSYNQMNNYLAGIQDTGEALLEFIELMKQESSPVIVVAFGDHSPTMDESMNEMMGLSMDENTEQGYRDRFATPCLIWANEPAKTVTGKNFQGTFGSVDPAFLLTKLFVYLGWQGDRYQNYLQDAMSEMSVDKEGFHILQGKYQRHLRGKDKEAHHQRLATEAAVRTKPLDLSEPSS